MPIVPLAHGLVQRADLPLPEAVFGWAAAAVLIVSFIGLAVLWPQPKLERSAFKPLLRMPAFARVLTGAVAVFLLALTITSGFAGPADPQENFAPTFVFVVFWVGLAFASLLLGDVFRAFNPWLALGRLLPAPRRAYPERLGNWPAAAGLAGFAWLELASAGGQSSPRNVAIGALVYTAVTVGAMAVYGAEAWAARGEAFGVYFNLLSRVSVVGVRDGVIGLRRPLSALTRFTPVNGSVALLAVMIGTTTFDGFSQGAIWKNAALNIQTAFEDAGAGFDTSTVLTNTLGLSAAILAIGGFYALGVAGARTVGGSLSAARLRAGFVHSLVPISIVYVFAHYLTFLIFQGQAMAYLASDPLGKGWDLFGTADAAIDFGVISQNATWYLQVLFVVCGHVAALTLAHDRALTVYDDGRLAVRSQYWMLAVMVGFTTLALWLLASAGV